MPIAVAPAPRRRPTAALAAAALVAAAPVARAATYTWSGGGATSNFNLTANWTNNAAPSTSGTDVLQFTATTGNKTAPNAQAAYALGGLTFASGAAAFGLTGSTLTLGSTGLTDSATNAETVANAVVANATQPWSLTAGSSLKLTGTLAVSPAATLTLSGTGTFAESSTVTVGSSGSTAAGLAFTGPTATITSLLVGTAGPGVVNQTAGSVTATTVTLGSSAAGTYNLSGGTLLTAAVRTGGNAAGTLSINGGTLKPTAAGTLLAAAVSTVVGTSGGTVDTNGYAATVAGPVADAAGSTAGLTKAGTGALSVTGAVAVPLAIAAGSVVDGNTTALAASTVTVNVAGGLTFAAQQGPQQPSYTLGGLAGSAAVNYGTAALSVGNDNADTAYAGVLAGSGAFTKLGTGTLTLSATNSLTGGLTLYDGTLAATVAGSLGTGRITFAGGTLQYAGTNATDYSARFDATAGQEYSVDTNGRVVTFATALNSAGAFLNKVGTGTLTLTAGGSLGTGVYAAGGTLALTGSAALGTAAAPTYVGVGDYTGASTTAVVLSVAGSANVYASELDVGNDGPGVVAQSGGTVTTASLVFVAGDYNLSGGTLAADALGYQANNNDASGSLHLDGGTLRTTANADGLYPFGADLDLFVAAGGARLDTNGSNVYLDPPLQHLAALTTPDGGLTKLGTGSLVFAPTSVYASTYTGPTVVSAGTLIAAAAGLLPTSTALTVHAAATFAVYDLGDTGPFVVPLGSLTLDGSTNAWTGTVDVDQNALVVAGGANPAATLALLTNYAKFGAAGGTWNGPGGLVSYSAAADPAHLTAVAVVPNNDGTGRLYAAFGGYAPALNDVLVAFTFDGDANLDGVVDGRDYARLDAGYASNGALTGWLNGDFNYDGRIDGSDYTLIDNAFALQAIDAYTPTAFGGTATGAAVARSTAELAPPAAVPEPAALLLPAAVVAAAGHRRSRRR